ncbi:MAG TPA: DUF4129 domain-containing protein [Pyrinomonadaceae bacterium]|nr:DUF4129 domain-containing protein [Pyrinomonadaceae bacterium]
MEKLPTTKLVRLNSRPLARVFTSIIVLLTVAATVHAISIDQYHSNLRQAVSALDSLSVADETESDEAYETRRTETIGGVRRLVPGSQTIESGESTMTVNNSWLHLDLDKFAKAKNEERPDLLRQITERLQALEQRVDELEKASPTRANDKDEANRKLKEILLRPEFTRKAKGQSALSRLMERFLEWLRSLFPEPKPVSPGRAGIFSQIAQVVVVILALGVLALVLKMFLPRLLRNRKPRKRVKQEARIVLGETLAPDQSALDLLSEAEALARRGELRAAIRKAYIALLVELGDRKVIHLAEHKTNRDYLSAVYSNQPLYGNVRQLTDSFERHWYGLAQASESDWQAFRSTYQRTLR